MPRQEITQVVQNPLLPPKVDRTIEELRAILSGGSALAADAIRVAARDQQLETQRVDAAARLDKQKAELQGAAQMQGLETQLGQERMKYRANGELLEVLEKDIEALEENERNGALALLG